MKRFRRNDGFTLVELMVTILVGSIVTLAATTVLLLGLRINKQSNETATRQNASRIILSVLEDVAAEGNITIKENSGSWQILNEDNEVRFYYKDSAIYTGQPGTGVALMENVSKSSITLNGNLFTIRVESKGEQYASSVYCRAGSSNSEDLEEESEQTIIRTALDAVKDNTNLYNFLDSLTSQLGSEGYIIGSEKDTNQYYSQWYIGGYNEETKTGWNANTPWCVCYISWAMEESGAILNPPKYANVDTFCASFTGKSWKNSSPTAGDIIFFDWIVDSENNPQHAGVVLQVKDGYIYTIEGNTDGVVAVRKYAADDKRILGYGILNWPE